VQNYNNYAILKTSNRYMELSSSFIGKNQVNDKGRIEGFDHCI